MYLITHLTPIKKALFAPKLKLNVDTGNREAPKTTLWWKRQRLSYIGKMPGAPCRWLWKECDSLRQNSQSHESFGRNYGALGVRKKKDFWAKEGEVVGWGAEDKEVEWDVFIYLQKVYIYIADMMLWCFVCQSILHESYHKYCFVSCSLLGLLLQLEWHFLTTFPLPFWSLAQEIFSTQPMAFKKSWALATLS